MKKQTKYLISGGVFAFIFALTLFLSNNLIGDTYAASLSDYTCNSGYHVVQIAQNSYGCCPSGYNYSGSTRECTKFYMNGGSNVKLYESNAARDVCGSYDFILKELESEKWYCAVGIKVAKKTSVGTSDDTNDISGSQVYYAEPTCTSTYLEYGCDGSYVKDLQTKLNAVYGCGLTVDGDFGSNTKTCVENFQRYFGLDVDGIVGTNTLSKLNSLYNSIKVTLNNASATTAGTAAIYEKYNRGYYLDSAGSNKITTSSNKITVPKKAYTVTYNYNGGTTSDSTKTASYTFGGYYTKSGGSGTQYVTSSGYLTSGASNKYFTSAGTLYAKWSGGSISLANATRDGYTFDGWYTKASGGTKIGASGASYSPTSNITLYAHYTKVLAEGEEDTETHTPDDASILGDVDVSGTINEADYDKLSDYVNENISLTDSEKANADLNSDGKIDITDQIILRKYLDGVTGFTSLPVTGTLYKVTFNLNYDDEKIYDLVTSEGTVNRPTISRYGHFLENWYTDEDLTTEYDFSTKVTSDVNLYAKWIERDDYSEFGEDIKLSRNKVVGKDKTDDELTTNNKTGSAFIIVTIVLAIISLGLCGFFLYKQRKNANN